MAQDLHHVYSTLLKCPGCNGLGAITWNLKYREMAQDRAFVALAGDFRIDKTRIPGDREMIVCTECDAIYGPLPPDSSQ